MSDRAALSQSAPEQARVFFALWPDARVCAALDRLAQQLHGRMGGRRTRPETLHLTLLFIGMVPRASLTALHHGAAELRLPAFELALDKTECWRHNRIACLTLDQPPLALLDLVSSLEGMADRLGIAYDPRPFRPHVTLLRGADCRAEAAPCPRIQWPVQSFALVESRPGPQGRQYPRLGEYPLLP